MTWHFLEVWLLVTAMFIVGCLLGAWLYGFIADSRLAIAQGIAADSVGDVLDRVKARLGLGPAWRPVHLRQMERSVSARGSDTGADEYEDDGAAVEYGRDEPAHAPNPEPGRGGMPRRAEPVLRKSEASARPAARKAERELAPAGDDAPPVISTSVVVADNVVPTRPAGLGAPRGGVPDNLQRIKGIGKRNEVLLNSLGIFHFGQIAAWTPGEMRWIGKYLAFPERIERDDWVRQAIVLAMGSETGFEKSADRRRQRRRQEREFKARMAKAAPSSTDAAAVPAPTEEETGPPPGDEAFVEETDDAFVEETYERESLDVDEPQAEPEDEEPTPESDDAGRGRR